MRRKACALLMSAALGGCMSADKPDAGPACSGSWGTHQGPPTVPGVMGPNGTSIPMAAPYNVAPPGSIVATFMSTSRPSIVAATGAPVIATIVLLSAIKVGPRTVDSSAA